MNKIDALQAIATVLIVTVGYWVSYMLGNPATVWFYNLVVTGINP